MYRPMLKVFIIVFIFPLFIAICNHNPRPTVLFLVVVLVVLTKFVPKHTNQLQQSRLRAPDIVCWRLKIPA